LPLPRHSLTVADELNGIALADFLEREWPEADRKDLRALVQEGKVRWNGMPAKTFARLRAGDSVEVDVPKEGLAKRRRGAPPIAVLYSDPQLLIVSKPAGLTTVPDRSGEQRGVHGRLRELRPDGDLRIVHRLDRETSGCLALADGLEAARFLDLEFREGRIEKRYLALVQGLVARDELTVEKALGPDPRKPGRVRVVAEDSKGARSAKSEVAVVERFAKHTLVRVTPRTGRGHQIRVHLAAVHHPIVADRDYGGGEGLLLSELKHGYKHRRGVAEKPLLARTFLHAESLALTSPHTKERVEVHCPLPEDLELALDKVRQLGGEGGRR
jgi:RluA family pseudouridine synthase